MAQTDTRILKSAGGYSQAHRFPGDILPERLANRFRPIEWLNRTHTAEVFLANDSHCSSSSEEVDDVVRLHILRRELQDAARVNLFHLELKAASKLSHPKITRAVGIDHGSRAPVYIVEHKPGYETLRQLLDRTGWLEIDKAIRVISDIATGLQHAHENGVVHLNLHPENVLVDSAGNAILTGFGLEAGRDLERAGGMRSSHLPAEYASPEQIRGDGLDSRTDLYSVGVILFEMLTDRTPFAAGTPELVRCRQAAGDACSVSLLRTEVPELLAATESRLLERNPDNRIQTASELIATLDHLITEKGPLDAENIFADDPLEIKTSDLLDQPNADDPGANGETATEPRDSEIDDVLDEIDFDGNSTDTPCEDQSPLVMKPDPEVVEPAPAVAQQTPFVLECAGQQDTIEMPSAIITQPAWLERGKSRLAHSSHSSSILGSQLIRVPRFISGISETLPQNRTRRVLIFMLLVAVGIMFLVSTRTEREKEFGTTTHAQNPAHDQSVAPGNPTTPTKPDTAEPRERQSQINANSGANASNVGSTQLQSASKTAPPKRSSRARRSGYVRRRPAVTFNDPYGRRIRWLRRPDPDSIR